ncbi:uncharacterized protein B0J16DRAFT_336091 [Fusarium flagelliforme]|uniref:uncharacterized protein n=1 Tax=Fusarium flagelliforme TaxID=2675880 RepID=UPI001E8DF136|nr:uncharacterized protein B0J16DRAFT_336091 [Fusarium flagelliforme]KAH7193837.1 hypothetical protein B0J16DRAFT_336091 [Fusarium flagelliforme]
MSCVSGSWVCMYLSCWIQTCAMAYVSFQTKGGKMSRGFDSRSDVSLECGLPFMRVLFTLFFVTVCDSWLGKCLCVG